MSASSSVAAAAEEQQGAESQSACAASGGRRPPPLTALPTQQTRRRDLLPLVALAVVTLLMLVSSLPLLVVSTRHGSLPRHGAQGGRSGGCSGGWLRRQGPCVQQEGARPALNAQGASAAAATVAKSPIAAVASTTRNSADSTDAASLQHRSLLSSAVTPASETGSGRDGGAGAGAAPVTPPQLTVVLPTTFKDTARALASLSSVRLHMHPDLLAEVMLVTPWEEFLALRHALTPTLAGPSCPADCYSPPGAGSAPASDGSRSSSSGSSKHVNSRRVSRVPTALRAAGLSPRLSADADLDDSAGRGSAGSSGVVCPSQCGPPVWVVPEHVVLRVSRRELQNFRPNGYRLQMVLKLAVSWLVSTPHYLVLDSDVLQVRHVSPANAHWLFPAPGRALYQPQRRATHAKWWAASEALLGLRGCLDRLDVRGQGLDAHVFGVTPAILSTRIAAETVAFWERSVSAVARAGNASGPAAASRKKGRGAAGSAGSASRALLGDASGGSGASQHQQQPVPLRTSHQASATSTTTTTTAPTTAAALSAPTTSSGAGGRAAWQAALSVLLPARRPFFTEYTSYHLVAECVMGVGTLLQHHVSPWAPRDPATPAPTAAAVDAAATGGTNSSSSSSSATGIKPEQAPRLYRGLWRRGGGGARGNNASGGMAFDWSDPHAHVTPCADCVFLVVQSNMGAPERRVVGDLQQQLLLRQELEGEAAA